MKDFARGALVSIFVFALLGVIGWFAMSQFVVTPEALNTTAVVSAPAQIDGFDDPFADDASRPTEGQIDTYLQDIGDALLKWNIAITGSGFLCAFCWFASSAWIQRWVVGPAGQENAFAYWVFFALVFLGLCAGTYFFWIEPLGFGESMNDVWQFSTFITSTLIGLLGYWLATTLAATPVMKPSVPFATRFARI